MSNNIQSVAYADLPAVLQKASLPLIIVYTDPTDVRYRGLEERVGEVAAQHPNVPVLTVAMDSKRLQWFSSLYGFGAAGQFSTPYDQSNYVLPTLQVIETENQRNCVPGERPKLVSGPNVPPSLPMMFKRVGDQIEQDESIVMRD